MFGAILRVTNSIFQKGKTFCRSIYVKNVMKLLAFIFEHPSYLYPLVVLVKLASEFDGCVCCYMSQGCDFCLLTPPAILLKDDLCKLVVSFA